MCCPCLVLYSYSPVVALISFLVTIAASPPPPPKTPATEWARLFERTDYYETLRAEALTGNLQHTPFPGLLWMVSDHKNSTFAPVPSITCVGALTLVLYFSCF